MTEQPQSIYYQAEVGFEFPSRSYKLEAEAISLYLKASEEPNPLFQERHLVPPMAVAANALAALNETTPIPPGTIHISQELDFLGEVFVGDTITCKSKVSRKIVRGGLNILTIDVEVIKLDQQKVMGGKIGIMLP